MTDSPNLALAEKIEDCLLDGDWQRLSKEEWEQVIAPLRAQPSGDWVMVSERLPSDLEIVQVWGITSDEDEGWSIAQFDADEEDWHCRFDGGCVSIETVTHWMPLPQPPALSAAKERG